MRRFSLVLLLTLLAFRAPGAFAQPAGEPATMIHVHDGHFLDSTANGTVVQQGAVITVMSFVNSDHTTKAHSLTADDGKSFDVAIPQPSTADGYAYVNFTAALAPGQYPYHSKMVGDGAMHGIIIVQGAATAQKASPGPGVLSLGLALAIVVALGRRARG